MARIGFNEVEKFGKKFDDGIEFLKLKDDGDFATVRFLIEDKNDHLGLETISYHEVNINGKKRKVNCLREVGDNASVCPLCSNKNYDRLGVAYYIHLIEYEKKKKADGTWEYTGEANYKVFERGKQFQSKITLLMSRYANQYKPVFDIIRSGVANSLKTDYMILENTQVNPEEFELLEEDWSNRKSVLGILVLDKTFEELVYFVENGKFADQNQEQSEGVVRRGETGNNQTARTFGRRGSL